MPRMPYHEYDNVETVYIIDNSTDTKIAMLDAKLSAQIEEKQNKLTAGDNITIENNTISSTADLFKEGFTGTGVLSAISREVAAGEKVADVIKEIVTGQPQPTTQTSMFIYDGTSPLEELEEV